MKVSLQWLSQWVPIDRKLDALCELLTMAGLEVDGVAPAAPPLEHVVVARVVNCGRHPNADKLSLCEVDDGSGAITSVVCGAPNVASGQTVAYAKPGAVLPNGMKLKVAKLRGVESHGMLCSAAELELGEGADGIITLPNDAPLGQPLSDYLHLNDQIIDIDLTPNRGDCLSILGVAREIAALTEQRLTPLAVEPVPPTIEQRFPVQLEAPDACARYAGRIIRGIDPGASSPLWLVEVLRRAGVRSISPIVDITNYVMLELGQPMHAFDLDKLQGGIRVRRANNGESLELLDGQTIELESSNLVIADESRPIALAGIMGGEQSGVQAATTNILLESAYFDAIHLAGVARRFRMHTDASHRFERGVDFTQQERAIERATALILEVCGGLPGPIECAESVNHLPERSPISFRPSAVPEILGVELAEEVIEGMLSRLGCHSSREDTGWQVSVPSYRFDLSLEVDLVEEIARLHGYEQLGTSLPQVGMTIDGNDRARPLSARLRTFLIDNGYYESITYSFIDDKLHELFCPDLDGYRLENPISSDMSVMRASLWPGLVSALQYNQNRQQSLVRLFEVGRVFERRNGALQQPVRLAGVAAGSRYPEQWGVANEEFDYFDIKQIIEGIISISGLTNVEYQTGIDPVLHPGQSASLTTNGKAFGKLGLMHPRLVQHLGVRGRPVLFEIALDQLVKPASNGFRPVSKFPAVRRDLSVVVAENQAAGGVLESARNAAGELLRDLQLFDVFRGQGIDSGKKSLTLGLIFQAPSRTLTEDEIETSVQRVLSRLSKDFDATLRE